MKSCKDCICGYFVHDGKEYHCDTVYCYSHPECGGNEPTAILEDEFEETAEKCPNYTFKVDAK